MGIMYVFIWSTGGLSVSYSTYCNLELLYSLVSASAGASVQVLRGPLKGGEGSFKRIAAEDLVPGDVIVVEEGPCVADCALIKGSAVLDESSLTGESMPVHKVRKTPVELCSHFASAFASL